MCLSGSNSPYTVENSFIYVSLQYWVDEVKGFFSSSLFTLKTAFIQNLVLYQLFVKAVLFWVMGWWQVFFPVYWNEYTCLSPLICMFIQSAYPINMLISWQIAINGGRSWYCALSVLIFFKNLFQHFNWN